MDHVNAAEWVRDFRRRSAVDRVPITGILELTSRCNLKCVHCYLGPQEEQRQKRSLEMTTERVKEVIDQVVAEGCLYLVITGGDPMVRKDFPEVYRYAREQGLIVTVFCDGVLVTDTIVELFKEYPPNKVDISLYGATAETYERVTRIPGSFPRCVAGIRRLLDNGIPVGLKTVLMTINKHELEAMREMARDLGVGFRMDSAIFPCLPTHDHEPLDLRVDAKEAVELEMSEPDTVKAWVKYVEEREELPRSDALYVCGAGVSSFYVDPFGFASPCLMTTHYRYEIGEERSFASLWGRELVQLRDKKPREGYACNSCEMKLGCNGCPAFNYLETGAEDVKSDYVCETTNHRWTKIQEARNVESVAAAKRTARRAAAAPALPSSVLPVLSHREQRPSPEERT